MFIFSEHIRWFKCIYFTTGSVSQSQLIRVDAVQGMARMLGRHLHFVTSQEQSTTQGYSVNKITANSNSGIRDPLLFGHVGQQHFISSVFHRPEVVRKNVLLWPAEFEDGVATALFCFVTLCGSQLPSRSHMPALTTTDVNFPPDSPQYQK
ncbi:hypothetical protein LSAT2_000527 [Lamellibrachia satsuma]|nr:hypothetical protein LSAT2_000527 [Lamellibrachia satsuma]